MLLNYHYQSGYPKGRWRIEFWPGDEHWKASLHFHWNWRGRAHWLCLFLWG